ncbi:MAG: HAD-IA family hydrolase [Armatimonadetes bacterium]|nr:HAD-IA family hydrolase [Armatimonadota bacterium]
MPLDALILDVDGTLVDTNPIHVAAFVNGFKQFCYVVAPDRIAPEIGKGGDHLIPDVLGYSAHKKDGENIKTAIKKQFLDTIANNKVALLPGAIEIIEAAKKRGLKVAIATSGEKEFLEAIEKSCGVTFSELVDLVITSTDAKESKPSPDIVSAASQKLGLTPAQCAMVGDTPHDARACRAAGVVCFGLETGGHEGADLREAGCRRVYADCAEIAAHFDDFLQIAAPVRARLTQDVLEKLMREALQTARQGMEAGEAPVGSVVANGDGEIIARGWNSMNATQNKTAHAEMVAFADAAGKVPLDAKDLILVSTLEPCVMCLGAAMEAGVDVVIYALEAPFDGGSHRVSAPRSPESLMPRIVGPVLEAESRELFEEWLNKNRDSEQAAYIKQLLGEEKED